MRAAALRSIRALPDFFSDEVHQAPLEQIVTDWLNEVAPGEDFIAYDPAEVGEQIASALRQGVRLAAPEFDHGGGLKTFRFPSYTGFQEVDASTGSTKAYPHRRRFTDL